MANNNNRIAYLDVDAYKNRGGSASSLDDIFTSKPATSSRASKNKGNKNNGLGILGRGMGMLLPSIGAGVTKAVDSILDAPFTIGNAITQAIYKDDNSYEAQNKKALAKYLYDAAQDTHILGKNVAGKFENWVDTQQQKIVEDNPNSNLANIVYKGTELAESAGRMLPTMAVTGAVGSAITGAAASTGAALTAKGVSSIAAQAPGLAAMWLGVYDTAVDEAVKSGKDFEYASKVGFVDATVEVATELMWNGIAGIGKGVGYMNKLVDKMSDTGAVKQLRGTVSDAAAGGIVAKAAATVSKIADTSLGKGLLSELTIGDMAQEAIEEMASEFLSPLLERAATGDKTIETATFGQVLEAGLGGALMSAFMAPTGKLANTIAQNRLETQMTNEISNWSELSMVNKANIMNRYMAEGWSGLDEEAETIQKTYGEYLQLEDIKRMSAFDKEVRDYVGQIRVTAETTPEEFAVMEQRFAQALKLQSQINVERVLAKQYRSAFGTLEARVLADPNYQAALNRLTEAQEKYDQQVKATEAAQDQSKTKGKGKKGKAKKGGITAETLKQLRADAFSAKLTALASAEQAVANEYAAGTLTGEELQEYEAYLHWSNEMPSLGQTMANGYAIQEDETGAPQLLNRERLAQSMFGGNAPSYDTMRSSDLSDVARNVDEEFKSRLTVRDARDAAANQALADEINAANAAKGVNSYKVEVRDLGVGEGAASHLNGTIVLNSRYIQSPADADFYLGHESIHNIFDTLRKSGDTEALNEFKQTLDAAIAFSGNDKDAWTESVYKIYKKNYLRQELQKYCTVDPKTGETVPLPQFSNTKMADIYRIANENAQARFAGGTYKTINEDGTVSETQVEGEGEEEVYAKFVSFLYSSTGFLDTVMGATPELMTMLQGELNNSSLNGVSNEYLADRVKRLNEIMQEKLQNKVDAEKSLLKDDEIPNPREEAGDMVKADWLLNQADPNDREFYHYDPSLLPPESSNWTLEQWGDWWEKELPPVRYDNLGHRLSPGLAKLASRAHPYYRNSDNELKVLYHNTDARPFSQFKPRTNKGVFTAHDEKMLLGLDQYGWAMDPLYGGSAEYIPGESGDFVARSYSKKPYAEYAGGYYRLYGLSSHPIIIDARNKSFMNVPMSTVMDDFVRDFEPRPELREDLKPKTISEMSLKERHAFLNAYSDKTHYFATEDNFDGNDYIVNVTYVPSRVVSDYLMGKSSTYKSIRPTNRQLIVGNGQSWLLISRMESRYDVEDSIGLELEAPDERAKWKKFLNPENRRPYFTSRGTIKSEDNYDAKLDNVNTWKGTHIDTLFKAAQTAGCDGLIVMNAQDIGGRQTQYISAYNKIKSIYSANPDLNTDNIFDGTESLLEEYESDFETQPPAEGTLKSKPFNETDFDPFFDHYGQEEDYDEVDDFVDIDDFINIDDLIDSDGYAMVELLPGLDVEFMLDEGWNEKYPTVEAALEGAKSNSALMEKLKDFMDKAAAFKEIGSKELPNAAAVDKQIAALYDETDALNDEFDQYNLFVVFPKTMFYDPGQQTFEIVSPALDAQTKSDFEESSNSVEEEIKTLLEGDSHSVVKAIKKLEEEVDKLLKSTGQSTQSNDPTNLLNQKADWLLNQLTRDDPAFYRFDPAELPADSKNWTTEEFGDYWESHLEPVMYDSEGTKLPPEIAKLASRTHPYFRDAQNRIKVLYHGTHEQPFSVFDNAKNLDNGIFTGDNVLYVTGYNPETGSYDSNLAYGAYNEYKPDDDEGFFPENGPDENGGYYKLYAFSSNPIIVNMRRAGFDFAPISTVIDEFTNGKVRRPELPEALRPVKVADLPEGGQRSLAKVMANENDNMLGREEDDFLSLAMSYNELPKSYRDEMDEGLYVDYRAGEEGFKKGYENSLLDPNVFPSAYFVSTKNVPEESIARFLRKIDKGDCFGIPMAVRTKDGLLIWGNKYDIEDHIGLNLTDAESRAQWKQLLSVDSLNELFDPEGTVFAEGMGTDYPWSVNTLGHTQADTMFKAARLAGRDGVMILETDGGEGNHTEYITDYMNTKSIYNTNPDLSQEGFRKDAFYNDEDAAFEEQYRKLQEKYGTYGETGVPKKLDKDTGISKFLANVASTEELPEALNPAIKHLAVDACTNAAYSISRDPDALDYAYNWLKKFETKNAEGQIGYDLVSAAKEYITLSEGGKVTDKRTIVKGQAVIREIMQKIAQKGDTATADEVNLFSQMVAAVSHDETRAGQVVQAASLLKKMTPTGRLYFIDRAITDILDELKSQKDSIFSSAKKATENLEDIRSSEEYIAAVTEMANATTQKELDDAEQHLVEIVAKQIPPTITSRLMAWRYLSMLGNIRTHERNIISNAASYIASGLTTKLSGFAQDLFVKNGEKTATLKQVSEATKAFVKNDWDVYGSALYKSGGKMATFQTKVEQAQRKFGENAVGNLLEKAYNINNEGRGTDDLLGGLEGEDTYFGKLNYKMAMEQYITANNIDVSIFTNPATKNTRQTLELLDKIRGYAMQQANRATYHEANQLASKLNELERNSPLGKLLVGGIAPFKRTPVNILKQGVKYSPAGFFLGLKELGVDVKNGKMSVGEAVNDICQGMTGTMLFVLGMFLKGAGMAKAGGSDNDREEYYDEMLGHQKYSITLGDTNYTLDWLTPISMPLFAGVTLMEAMEQTEDDAEESLRFVDILGAIGTTFDPLTNLSLLSGINDAMSAYGDDNKIMQLGLSAAESFATQFIPTMAGQVARAVDPTRRTTYAPKDSDNFLGSRGEKFLRRIAAKLPFVSFNDEPYVDMWGNEDIREGSLAKRLADQMLVPWYSAKVEATSVDDRLSEVFAEAGTPTVLPATPNSYLTVNGETRYLNAQEYTAFKKIAGQLSYNGVDTATAYNVFNSIDAELKADIISDIYSMSRTYAKYQWARGKGIKNLDQYSKSVSKTDATKIKKLEAALDSGMSFGQYMTIKKLVGQKSKKAEKIQLMNSIGISGQWQALFLN